MITRTAEGVWMWHNGDSVARRIAMDAMHALGMDAGGDWSTRDKIIVRISPVVEQAMDEAARGGEIDVERTAAIASRAIKHAELVTEIMKIVTDPADRLCWLDVYHKLAGMVGIPFEPVRLRPDVFKANCERFCDSLHSGKPYIEDEATAEIVRLRARVAELEAGHKPS